MAGFDYRTEAELFPLVRRKFTKGGSDSPPPPKPSVLRLRSSHRIFCAVPILKSPRRGSMRKEFAICTRATHIR